MRECLLNSENKTRKSLDGLLALKNHRLRPCTTPLEWNVIVITFFEVWRKDLFDSAFKPFHFRLQQRLITICWQHTEWLTNIKPVKFLLADDLQLH